MRVLTPEEEQTVRDEFLALQKKVSGTNAVFTILMIDDDKPLQVSLLTSRDIHRCYGDYKRVDDPDYNVKDYVPEDSSLLGVHLSSKDSNFAVVLPGREINALVRHMSQQQADYDVAVDFLKKTMGLDVSGATVQELRVLMDGMADVA